MMATVDITRSIFSDNNANVGGALRRCPQRRSKNVWRRFDRGDRRHVCRDVDEGRRQQLDL